MSGKTRILPNRVSVAERNGTATCEERDHVKNVVEEAVLGCRATWSRGELVYGAKVGALRRRTSASWLWEQDLRPL